LYSFSKKERWALAGLIFMLIPAMLINLGLVPLYVEEPRRATVALEMILSGNWLVPTINGSPYFLKPPLFNWILAIFYQVTGSNSELVTRIPTVLSLITFGLIIFFTGRKYVGFSFGALSALLFITASGNLFFNSLLAEIDIFYSMITYLSLVGLFHFHQQRKFLLLFASIYFLGAAGTLTKGLPSAVFTGLSLLAFFIAVKEFKRLFTWSHITGILIYVIIVGAYFLAYNRDGDAVRYIMNLTVESGKRLSGDTFWDYLQHLALYPLDTLMNLLPASILIIFIFRKSFLKIIRENAFMKFAVLMVVVHFPVYWLPPGGRQRYIIMLYPFIIQIFTYFFLIYLKEEKARFRVLSVLVTSATGFGALASLAPLFIAKLDWIAGLWPVCIVTFLLMAVLFFFQLKKPAFSIINLLFATVILRLWFGQVVLPVRATEGGAPENKESALEIVSLAEGHDICILKPTYLPMQSIFYLEKERHAIVPLCQQLEPGRLVIAETKILSDYYHQNNKIKNGQNKSLVPDYKVLLEFTLKERNFLLVDPIHPHP
jgi:4-amino-4-deoxy-L-arabinose transferase-like glycosyltransferase